MKDRVAISVSLPTPVTDLDKIKLPCVVVCNPGRDAVRLDKAPRVSRTNCRGRRQLSEVLDSNGTGSPTSSVIGRRRPNTTLRS
ncbi:hypothetical protein GCM10027360_63680 [Amycolatopsis echigonensis]|uniref:Uncharacterized protein n=1 Tax=Amycolatopsis tucumanensis TaxID=401106 RepID=A0ABP7JTJ5_9PSEU